MGNIGVVRNPRLEARYLEEKDHILRDLGHIKPYLDAVLDNELHQKLLRRALTLRLFRVRMVDGKTPDPTFEELKPNLLKMYRRYYKVHRSGQMPDGAVRINPDPEYKNFYNRMKLVMKDFDSMTELDK